MRIGIRITRENRRLLKKLNFEDDVALDVFIKNNRNKNNQA